MSDVKEHDTCEDGSHVMEWLGFRMKGHRLARCQNCGILCAGLETTQVRKNACEEFVDTYINRIVQAIAAHAQVRRAMGADSPELRYLKQRCLDIMEARSEALPRKDSDDT